MVHRGAPISSDGHNKVVEVITQNRLLPGFGYRVEYIPGQGTRLYLEHSNGISINPYSKMSWGWKQIDNDASKVLALGGIISRGTRTPIIVPDAWVSVAGGDVDNPSYVNVTYNLVQNSAAINQLAVSAPKASSSTEFNFAIHSWYKREGRILFNRLEDTVILGTVSA